MHYRRWMAALPHYHCHDSTEQRWKKNSPYICAQPCSVLSWWLNYSMHDWEASSCLANQCSSQILRSPKIRYSLHKNPPLVHTLRKINEVHWIVLRFVLILPSHVMCKARFSKSLFHSGFLISILYTSLMHMLHVPSIPPSVSRIEQIRKLLTTPPFRLYCHQPLLMPQ